MAKKLSDLNALTGLADDDLLLVTDVSDATSSASGTSKKVVATTLASGLLSDVGWLPVTIPTAEEDWMLTGTPSFAGGQVTLAGGESISAETLTGTGAAPLEQARIILVKVTLRAQVSDANTAASLVATVNHVQSVYPTPVTIRYNQWDSTPDLIVAEAEQGSNAQGHLTADPEEWHTVSCTFVPYDSGNYWLFSVRINDDWASWNHPNSGAYPTDGTSFRLAYTAGATETITVDLTQSSLEVKPLW